MDIQTALLGAQKKLKDSGITSASLDAEVLLLAAINHKRRRDPRDKNWLYLNAISAQLSTTDKKRFDAMLERRMRHEPIAYILNSKAFYDLDFYVDHNTLIPRPETELIVEEALDIIKDSKGRFSLIDIGTGSGCIPIAILTSIAGTVCTDKLSRVFADDISGDALKVARKNAKRYALDGKISFLNLDLEQALEKLPRHASVIITANLPYIDEKDYPLLGTGVRDFEPKTALVAGENGLSEIGRLIGKFASLRDDSTTYAILLEADPRQMRSIEVRAKKNLPGCDIRVIKDLRGKKRMIRIDNIRNQNIRPT